MRNGTATAEAAGKSRAGTIGTLAAAVALGAAFATCFSGCRKEPPARELRIFHAAGFTPALDSVRQDALSSRHIRLLTEGSGSQAACRKLTELGRTCDLIMLADNTLFVPMLQGTCSWRLDFATDEMVLGVGIRAPATDDAEKDWAPVLLRPDARIGRADENQSPLGYRTLLVWKLQEMRGSAGLCAALRKKCDKVMEDAGELTPLLKTGEVDYAFVYRSTCIASDIRYIALDRSINLGSADVDYSRAQVTFRKSKAGEAEPVTVTGAPVTWSLSIPDRDADASLAAEFIRYLLSSKAEALDKNGFRLRKPLLFYGTREAFRLFADVATYAGDLN
jgi:molybdate/tungstate transport system substrate-binding protein